jgi:predicted nucleotidyltransferase
MIPGVHPSRGALPGLFVGEGARELELTVHLQFDRSRIATFCRRNKIRRLSFFGSVLREDFSPDSDVDVLVEFEPGEVVGLRFIEIERELSDLLGGRPVDLVTPKFLNRRIRDRVLATADTQYAEG